jgi:hypothetical protein
MHKVFLLQTSPYGFWSLRPRKLQINFIFKLILHLSLNTMIPLILMFKRRNLHIFYSSINLAYPLCEKLFDESKGHFLTILGGDGQIQVLWAIHLILLNYMCYIILMVSIFLFQRFEWQWFDWANPSTIRKCWPVRNVVIEQQ